MHVTILDTLKSSRGKKLLIFKVFTVYIIIFLSPLSYEALKINLGNTDISIKSPIWLKNFSNRIPNTLQPKVLEGQGSSVFCFWFILATPRGMWDLNSLTRDQTYAPCSGSTES